MTVNKKLLPSSWQLTTLGELCEPSQYGYTAKAGTSGNYKFLRTTDITKQNITWAQVPYCNIDEDEAQKYQLRDGDIVISRAGSVGFSKLIYRPEKSVFASYLIRFRPLINQKFISFFLQSPEYWEAISEGSSGIAVQNVNAKMLSRISVPVAPEQEQIRIVEKLEELFSDLDDGVTELKAAQIKLNQYRQSLLKSAVEGSLTAEWREQNKVQETGEQLLERILKERRERWEKEKLSEFESKGNSPPKDWQKKYQEPVQPDTTDLPELPEGWAWASLDMIGEIVSGVTKGTKRKNPVPTREVPYLRVANVQRGYLDLTEIKTIEATEADIERYTLQKNDILFNEGGDRDKLGRGWVWRSEINGCIHQNHVFRLRLFISEVMPELISHYANTFGKLWFQHAGKQTTNLASINKGILQSFPIPLAPVEEQRVINEELEEKISQLEAQVEETSSALTLSEAQRKKILQDALSGKLVAQNPNDEPAIELLEKIKTERAKRSTQLQPKRVKRKPSEEAIVMENLEEVLKNKAGWVDAQEAFRECGVKDGTDTDRIEELYAELRKLDKEGRLGIERHGDYDKLRLKAE